MRDAAALPLLAVAPEDVGELGFVALVHQIGSRGAGLFHAHVERTGGAEREAARRLVELHGRHAEIERHTVDRRDACGAQQMLHFTEAALDQAEARRIALGERLAGGDGIGIAVDGDHLASGAIEERRRVAAAAEGAVDIAAAVARLERVDDFVQQHGNMTAHASPPVRPRTKASILARSASRRACQRLGFHNWNLSPLPTSITPSSTSSASANSAGMVKRPSGSSGMVRALAER